MFLRVLRMTLYGLLVLLLAAGAFFAGRWLATPKAAPAVALPAAVVVPEKRDAAKNFVEAALAARFRGDVRGALELLEAARNEDAALPGLDYQFGLTYLELQDYDAAEAAARRSVERGEELANAYALSGWVALKKARRTQSLEGAGDAVMGSVASSRAADPLSPAPFYVLAEYYRSVGRPGSAVEAYQRALERVSKIDSMMMATVKAGLSGLRLHHTPGQPALEPAKFQGAVPPEQYFFAAADALLRGDRETAITYLSKVRVRIPGPLFEALLKDSFFQDYLGSATIPDPHPETPQG
jgi:tetratricopeptide (TPR) repeat protein